MSAPCAVESCEKPRKAKGLCIGHWNRLRKHGDVQADVPLKPYRIEATECAAEGCARPRQKSHHCHAHAQRLRFHGDLMLDVPLREPITGDLCEVESCQKERAGSQRYCYGHLNRKRKGDLRADEPLREKGTGTVNSRGYWIDWNPEHPLATNDGYALRHRVLLYAAIGPGEHPCQWCGKRVQWLTGRAAIRGLVVDHRDGNRLNNELSNLVPACYGCNVARGKAGNPLDWKPGRDGGPADTSGEGGA